MLWVLALPIAASVGTFVHDSRARIYAEEAHDRHQVAAVATENGQASIRGRQVAVTADAAWSFDGQLHKGVLVWSSRAVVGAQQIIWVNSVGNMVDPPRSKDRAVSDAVLVALSSWMAVAAGSSSLVYLIHRKLDRGRYADWDRELTSLHDKREWGNR
uniref:Rv1733c family protein n=1 Tax=Mycolicibacterium frederiksbergense TaxID=117567 RepID=UPI0024750E86|nr:hypothetical protein [Mycolicibacterium frederiksbergense]